MRETKIKIRFFTIADFEEEEIWLRNEHKKGWKFVKLLPPCFYSFAKCEPEDVVYRLAYKNSTERADYMQLFADYGWENAGSCLGWLIFRKSASQIDNVQESELFSDSESKIQMLQNVIKTRLLPAFIVVMACVIPQAIKQFSGQDGLFILLTWIAILVVDVFLLTYCGLKLTKLKKKYKKGL